MMKIHVIVLMVIILIVGCGNDRQNDIPTELIKEIVLLDISTHSRGDVAKEINTLSRFNAKVIGITVFFEQRLDSAQDVWLELAIARANNVVLQAGTDDNLEILMPFKPFALAAWGNGLASFVLNDQNYFDRFIFLYQDSKLQVMHVAGLLASKLKVTDKTSVGNYRVNSSTPLPDIKKSEINFARLDTAYTEEDVKGKIVILGLLNDEDLVKVRIDGVISDIPASVLTAFLTMELLKE